MSGYDKGGKGLGKRGAKRHEPITRESLSLYDLRSNDGFEVSTFHRLCDDNENTLTLIKSTKGFVFGNLQQQYGRIR